MGDVEPTMVRKVRHVTSSGCELHVALSDGRRNFEAGIIYEIPDYGDFHRLIRHGDFEEVLDEVVEVLEEVSLTPTQAKVTVSVPDDDIIMITPPKPKGAN